MPLQGLLRRRNRKSDTDLRRQNIVDSSQPLRSSEYVPRNAHSALGTHLSPQGGVQSLDSAGSSTSMLASENTSPIDLASATDLHTLARPRFSLNRFRNASDPQLSTTAKARLDQDSRIPPRFPSGPTSMILPSDFYGSTNMVDDSSRDYNDRSNFRHSRETNQEETKSKDSTPRSK
jgi:hypothetical protein